MASKKGSAFERKICKQLSMWWSDGSDDAVFWRSDSSGARATSRGKKGKKTFGQYGDIQATNPIGQPLIDCCCIELKRGYKKWSFLDTIDKGKRNVKQVVEKFFDQVLKDRQASEAVWAVLIAKRDRRQPIIAIPKSMFLQIHDYYGTTPEVQNHLTISRVTGNQEYQKWLVLNLDIFLGWCKPFFFKDVARAKKAGRIVQ